MKIKKIDDCDGEKRMKNHKGLKCFVCDMETGIKIFNYKGYIEYFRKREKMKKIDMVKTGVKRQ